MAARLPGQRDEQYDEHDHCAERDQKSSPVFGFGLTAALQGGFDPGPEQEHEQNGQTAQQDFFPSFHGRVMTAIS